VVAVARRPGVELVSEELLAEGPDGPVPVTEVDGGQGSVIHQLQVPVGTTRLEYSATVRVGARVAPGLTDLERWEYTRPSRYAPSDRLPQFAAREFAGLAREELPARVAQWVFENTAYVAGSSVPTDTALETLLAREGVCRDFAHVTTAVLRALDVPARLCAVYAPGLAPMDFHAVVEAAPHDRWEVVDATRLAPRQSLLRIATGRDAADTAFLTTAGPVTLEHLEVVAVVAPDLPADDLRPGVALA
jgi:transglutaminase-like putative cysteine protease